MPFFLRNIWTGALLLFTVITLSTFFITKVWQVSQCPIRVLHTYRDLTNIIQGNHCSRSGWYLLVRRMLGPFRDHHGVLEGTRK